MLCLNQKFLIKRSDGTFKEPLDELEVAVYKFRCIKIPYTPIKKSDNKPFIRVPCGHCLLCRQSQREEWSLRCWLEAQEYDENQFVTLTYDDKYLPDNGVSKSEFSRFMHTLREHFRTKQHHIGIRFYGCGAYGDTTHRAHYHVLLFNTPSFGDETFYKKNKQGQSLYKSKILNRLWGKGDCTIGAVTRQSCDYVAKQILYSNMQELPQYLHYPFQSMSTQKGGIGFAYFQRHFDELIATDRIRIHGNRTVKLPRYFDRKIEEIIGHERFEKEIAVPRAEKARICLEKEMKQTGLSEEEIYKRRIERQLEKIEKEKGDSQNEDV